MVLLTMTTPIVEALEKLQRLGNVPDAETCSKQTDETSKKATEKSESDTDDPGTAADLPRPAIIEDIQNIERGKEERLKAPSLYNPRPGNPISHGQIIAIAKNMRTLGPQPHILETLLEGSQVYIAPPPLKPEPTSEYKALMARLRREEEARSYARMINPAPPMETFAQRFPASSAAHAFSSSHQNINTSDPDDDGLTFADVDRQMTLILNVLLSIVACAAAIWVAARWWSTPARLALSMSGSILVGIAEIVVYSGYIRRVGEAKSKEKSVKEIKEVVNTWVVAAEQDEEMSEDHDKLIMIEPIEGDDNDGEMRARKRRKDGL